MKFTTMDRASVKQVLRRPTQIVPPAEARAVAARCADAHSADRYRSWAGLARGLARRGFTAQEIEAVLRSKWTRWAADHSRAPWGRATFADLEAVLDKYSWKDLDDLVVGTFGKPEPSVGLAAAILSLDVVILRDALLAAGWRVEDEGGVLVVQEPRREP